MTIGNNANYFRKPLNLGNGRLAIVSYSKTRYEDPTNYVFELSDGRKGYFSYNHGILMCGVGKTQDEAGRSGRMYGEFRPQDSCFCTTYMLKEFTRDTFDWTGATEKPHSGGNVVTL